MADKIITFSKSKVTQKLIQEGSTSYITQLSKPIILKGISTKTCPNILYSIDGMNFTEETTIGDDNVLSMAIVPFQIGGYNIDEHSTVISANWMRKAVSYILGGRDVNEDINIVDPVSATTDSNIHANGAYRYLLQYLAKNKDKIEWDTGDLFSALDADKQDSFGGSDFITDKISVDYGNPDLDKHQLSIDKKTDANGSILKPAIRTPAQSKITTNIIRISQTPYFFLYPDTCPNPDGNQKLIIDNFWRGGGLLVSYYSSGKDLATFMLYIFAVS